MMIVSRLAALGVAAGLAVWAGFQLFWGLGGTWGLEEASGGTMEELGVLMSMASILLAFVVLGAAAIVLVRVFGDGEQGRFVHVGTWAIAIVLAFGGFANVLGETDAERFVIGPAALVLAALAVVVARSHAVAPHPAPPATAARA